MGRTLARKYLRAGAPKYVPLPPPGGRAAALREGMRAELSQQGFDFSTQVPPFANMVGIVALLLVMGALSALTYGSVAALLAEMFPPKIRYSSMSIPYHIGAGYLGGFLPLIAGYIVAMTGNAYAGLWYTMAVVGFGLIVAWWGLPDGPPPKLLSNLVKVRDQALPCCRRRVELDEIRITFANCQSRLRAQIFKADGQRSSGRLITITGFLAPVLDQGNVCGSADEYAGFAHAGMVA